MSRRWNFQSCAAALLVLGCAVSARAQEWGSLTGQFIYDGTPPKPAKVQITKDQEVCEKHPLVDETLLVSEQGGIANVIVYVRSSNVKVHPDLARSFSAPATLDNKMCRFEPHVLGVWFDKQKLIIKNSDPVGHNSNIQPFGETGVNPLLGSGKEVEYQFTRAQRVPVPVSCNLHPWMKAHVLPRDNPYFAVSDKDGKFQIDNLPAGELEFQAWHEAIGYLAVPDWRRGQFALTIKPGANDLGKVHVSAQLFEKK